MVKCQWTEGCPNETEEWDYKRLDCAYKRRWVCSACAAQEIIHKAERKRLAKNESQRLRRAALKRKRTIA
jgi:hypothetical protein